MRIAPFDGEVYTRCPMGKDGTKLLPGDTVYGEDGREWKLKAIGPTFCYADEGGRSYRLRAEWLTHERPDSWERLEEDVERLADCYDVCDYFKGTGRKAYDCDREDGFCCDLCVARDILRRSKALAESDTKGADRG